MCTSRQQTNPNRMQEAAASQGNSNIYPDLSAFQTATGQLQNPPIMQLLEALGLVPPGTQYTPSAPREDVTAQAPTNGPQATPSEPTKNADANSNESNGQRTQQKCEGTCHNCHAPPQQPTQQQPFTCNWDSWRYPSAGNQQQSYQCTVTDFPRFLANLGKILKNVFYCTTRVSSLAFLLIFLHMLTPVALLQNLVFMVLAAGLGLHLPTLMAGQLLWAGVGCLRVFEPFFLAGILIFSVHKMFVRREPLINQEFWRSRFINFRSFADNFNQQY